MTALNDYERLEATALWRPEGESQRREVVVSLGEATLKIADSNDLALTHWSLPAVERVNSVSDTPAVYAPASDSDERLEIDDEMMIEAIARVQRAIDRRRPRPGRLRGVMIAGVVAATTAAAVFWLPDALVDQATRIVPPVTRAEIGTQLLTRVQRLSGSPCETVHGARALSTLRTRLGTKGRVVIVDSGVAVSRHLPGGIILLNRALVEDYEQPQVVAGYILAEMQRAAERDPLEDFLREAGVMTTLRLLTTGEVPDAALDAHAEALLTAPLTPPDTDALIARFAEAAVPASPYAYAVDITGTQTLALIEADAVQPTPARPIMPDSQWVALQAVCGG